LLFSSTVFFGVQGSAEVSTPQIQEGTYESVDASSDDVVAEEEVDTAQGGQLHRLKVVPFVVCASVVVEVEQEASVVEDLLEVFVVVLDSVVAAD